MHAACHLSAGHPSLRYGHHEATGWVSACGWFRHADGHVLGRPFEVCMALGAKESASELTYVCTGRYRS